jgi:2-dehydro-3-deoxyphosphogluconate aldolase / (4S)-4-hydroxy-2-oxoglutarate aldolase
MENREAQLIHQMEKTALIPVFNHSESEVAMAVLDACYRAGIRVFEFTNRGSNAPEVFKKLKAYSAKYPDLYLGIGTIFSTDEAEHFIEAGADFLVSPALIPDVLHVAKSKNCPAIPGCATISEIYQAISLGTSLVKVFPGNVLGPEFVSAAKSVLPQVKLMPTGGVEPTQQNLAAWFRAGVSCVGMGSQLFSKDLIQTAEYTELEKRIVNALKIVDSVKL